MEHSARMRTSSLDWLALVLVIVGALNWGLIGLGRLVDSNWNLVNAIFGSIPALETLTYLLVGLAGLYELYFAYKLYDSRSERETAEPESAARAR